MTNLNNKSERTSEQVLFEKEIGKWLKKTRLSKTKVNPLTGRTMVVTQTKLAKHLGVTFQQIQKYEKGTNGVSSARLLQLANFLKVEIKFFFEDYQDFSEANQNDEKQSLNYSFLAKLLSELSLDEKNKVRQLLSADKEVRKAI